MRSKFLCAWPGAGPGVTDMSGKIVLRKNLGRLEAGLQTIDLSQYVQLTAGSYMFNFVFDGKYSFSEKMILE